MKKIMYALILITIMLFSECRPLPNIEPFADQTVTMTSAIGKSFSQTESLLSQTDICNGEVKKLRDSWNQTRQTLTSLIAYSDALASLVESGKKGEEVGKTLAGTLKDLAAKVGLKPVSEGLEIVTGPAAKIYGEIAKIRAKKSLKKAVETAQPVIEEISKIIIKNLDALNEINKTTELELLRINDESERYKFVVPYYKAMLSLDEIHVKELTLIAQYLTDPVQYELTLGGIKIKRPEELPIRPQVEERQRKLLLLSKSIQHAISWYRNVYESYLEREREIKENTKNTSRIIRISKAAIRTWASTHKKLKKTLNKKQRLSIRELASKISDINEVYKSFKKGGK